MKTQTTFFQLVASVSLFTLLTACDSGSAPETTTPEASAAAVTQQVQSSAVAATLPVSYNEVMVALVNEAADPIWMAAWKNPQTDKEWRQLELRAYQLKLAGTLLAQPGNGPIDKQWASRPEWAQWAKQLAESGSQAIAAVEARDLEDIGHAGDVIVEVCEGCHIDFKPALPTGGKYGELSPTPSDS